MATKTFQAMRSDSGNRLRLRVALLSVALAATPVCAAGTEAENRSDNRAEVAVQRSDLSNIVPAGQGIVIDNPYGDVRLRFGGYAHAVDIHATFQQRAGIPAITLEPRNDKGQHLIAPRLPEGATLADDQRVDLVVYVPERHPVRVRTERGVIEGRGVKSDLELTSTDGDIVLRGIDGTVQAETGGGTLEVSLNPAKPGSRQRLATRTGNILIGVNDLLDATLRMATSGVFATEYSLDINRRPGEEPNKEATTTIGSGNAELVLESRRGEIRILRRADYSPVPGEATADASDSGERR